MLSKAISIVAKAFEDKFDKGGQPLILHCLRVMNGVDQNDEELMCIAVMHDLLEECPEYVVHDLEMQGFSTRVFRAVRTLTRDADETYDDYISRVALNTDAKKVKLADLRDNMNLTRVKDVSKVPIKRYHKAYTFLSSLS